MPIQGKIYPSNITRLHKLIHPSSCLFVVCEHLFVPIPLICGFQFVHLLSVLLAELPHFFNLTRHIIFVTFLISYNFVLFLVEQYFFYTFWSVRNFCVILFVGVHVPDPYTIVGRKHGLSIRKLFVRICSHNTLVERVISFYFQGKSVFF